MSQARNKKISEEIKKIVSVMIMNKLKDPHISKLTSVTHVDTTRDLSYAYIYVSVFEKDEKKKLETIEALNNARGFVRSEIGKNLSVHRTPSPIFKLDESLEHGIHINELLSSISNNKDEDDE